MRALVFIWSFRGSKDPYLDSRIAEECIALSKKIKVIVVAEDISSGTNNNLSLIRVPKISVPFIQTLYRIFVYSTATIKHREKYDLVFVRTLNIPHFVAGIIARKFLKKKLVIWLSGSVTSHQGIRKKIFNSIARKTLDTADLIISSSDRVLDEIENYVGNVDRTKLSIMRQAVNIQRFKPLTNNVDDNILLSVGRIDPVKGFESIIESLPYVIEKIPNVKLKLIGSTENINYLNSLKDLISELQCEPFVEFVGPIPHGDLVNWYNSSKIFILTSKSEGQSNVTLEAMACGRPVIITPVSEISGHIQDGINGFLLKSIQPKLLAQKIIDLLNDENYRLQIGKAARKTIEENYTEDQFIDNLTRLLRNVIDQNHLQKRYYTTS